MITPTPRSYERLTNGHLARLSALASADRDLFYVKQPLYRGRHLATVLGQGGALHWLDGTIGVKDLDVWSFFSLPPQHDRFPADVRKVQADFGPSTLGRQSYDLTTARNNTERRKFAKWSNYRGRRVDLMLRGLACQPAADPATVIRNWLTGGAPGSSAWWLAQKAVILIDPSERREEQVWPVCRRHP